MSPTTVVDAPCKAEMKMEGVIRASVAKIRTTSFGGTSPDVFRENVVRFETEDIGECAVCVKHTRVGGRELEKTGRRWGFTRSCVHGLYGDGRLIASWCAYTALVDGTPVHVIHRQLLWGNLTLVTPYTRTHHKSHKVLHRHRVLYPGPRRTGTRLECFFFIKKKKGGGG